MSKLEVTVRREAWPLAVPITIARGTMSDADLLVVEVRGGGYAGRGEAYAVEHFGQSLERAEAEIRAVVPELAAGVGWADLHDRMPAGPGRNALDCALWDWRAKASGVPAWRAAHLPEMVAVETVCTLGIDTPAAMAAAAKAATGHDILKVKLGAPGDPERMTAIRAAVPEKRLIVDVNEGWTADELQSALPLLAELGVSMVEQPLPAGADDALARIDRLLPICADESCHTSADLDRVAGLYDMVNIKLDKTGGLTEGLALMRGAEARGLGVMIGCMLGTSLAMAPATLIAQRARFVDLDAPLMIGRDRAPGLAYANGLVAPPLPELWG